MDVEKVIEQIKQLSPEEKRRVEEALRASQGNGQHPTLNQAQWRSRVDEYFGAMRDDPISRGEQAAPQRRHPLIAAIAKTNHCTVVTDNTQEFSKVDGLPVENWLEP